MPTYGYRCPACQQEFEVVQRMTDESGAPCPVCATPARRVFFPTGIVFKGGGFYKTDSRKPDGNGAPSSAGAGSSAGKDSAPSTPATPSTPSTPSTPATPSTPSTPTPTSN